MRRPRGRQTRQRDGRRAGSSWRPPAAGSRAGPRRAALDDLPPPGQLGEDLVAGEGDVVEVADAHVGPQFAEHPGHELQLVVVHPDGRALGRPGRAATSANRRLTRTYASHQATVELRRGDDVVIERPERGVGRSPRSSPRPRPRQGDADQVHPVRRRTAPARRPPRPASRPRRRRPWRITGSSAVTRPPGLVRHSGSPSALVLVHRQPVGDHDKGEVTTLVSHHRRHYWRIPGAVDHRPR